MMKWFVVMVMDDCSVEHRDAITGYFRSTDHGWWHWVASTWIIEAAEATQVQELRDSIRSIAGNESFVVLEFPSEPNWAGFGPPKMFEWLRDESS